jgi:hypothetical protein
VPFYSKNKEGITSVGERERGRDKIKSTGTGRFLRRSMAKLLAVNGWVQR